VALGCAHAFAEDPDLCNSPGLGVSEWFPIAHAVGNSSEVTMIGVGPSLTMAAESIRTASREIPRT
jgi:hypothetical protein